MRTAERTTEPYEHTARRLAALSLRLAAEPEPVGVLARVIEAAVRLVPGADHAGVTLRLHGGPTTAACTHPLVARVDYLQYAAEEGPCLQALATARVVRADALRHERRWPAFTAGVRGTGVESVLSFPLAGGSGPQGSLNLYAFGAFGFPAGAEAIGAPLTAHASVALASATLAQQLRRAMASRDTIGKALGILMERFLLSENRARELLGECSQHGNIRMRDLADHLVATGEFPAGCAESIGLPARGRERDLERPDGR